MGRYIGPKNKLSRREGVDLFGNGGEKLARRLDQPPGVHGRERSRQNRQTEYSLQLREKQKAKRIYGMRERQFRRFFRMAQRTKELTGDQLLQLLERRLDNVIYRLGWARTRLQARQFITHGHVLVDGKHINIPSYLVKENQNITFKPKTQINPQFRELMETPVSTPKWLNRDAVEGQVLHLPRREDIETNVNEQRLVEFYTR